MGAQKNITLDVSIVIPARDEERKIKKCLQAVLTQDVIPKEIIVIDSGSTDRTRAIVKEFSEVSLLEIKASDFGHGKTRNLGVQVATGNIVVFLNGDAIPTDSHWLSSLIQGLGSEDRSAGAYSRHIPDSDCHLYMARDLMLSMPSKSLKKNSLPAFDYTLFSTVSAAIPRKLLESIPFDDHIVIAEDQDWARKVIQQGFFINYVAQSVVRHSHNYTLTEMFRVKARIGFSFSRFKNVFSAVLLGWILVNGGIIYKLAGDFVYICLQRIPLWEKVQQMGLSVAYRLAGFIGRYAGWIGSVSKP